MAKYIGLIKSKVRMAKNNSEMMAIMKITETMLPKPKALLGLGKARLWYHTIYIKKSNIYRGIGPIRINVLGAAKKKNTKSRNHFITLVFLPRFLINVEFLKYSDKPVCIDTKYEQCQNRRPSLFVILYDNLGLWLLRNL